MSKSRRKFVLFAIFFVAFSCSISGARADSGEWNAQSFREVLLKDLAPLGPEQVTILQLEARGWCHLQLNEFEKAAADYSQAINLAQKKHLSATVAYFGRASANASLKKYGAALGDYWLAKTSGERSNNIVFLAISALFLVNSVFLFLVGRKVLAKKSSSL